jgi:hypothetical protein
MDDISGDGGIVKAVLQEGAGRSPLDGHEVAVHFVGKYVEDGQEVAFFLHARNAR